MIAALFTLAAILALAVLLDSGIKARAMIDLKGRDVFDAFAKYIAEQEAAAKYPPELVERAFELVSEVARDFYDVPLMASSRARAILAELDALKVDPLVDAFRAIKQTQCGEGEEWSVVIARNLRVALADSGLHITEIQP